jgi:hypothetical protein
VLPAMPSAGGALIMLGVVVAEVGGVLQARRAEASGSPTTRA